MSIMKVEIEKAIVHPLVLLSVMDHHTRMNLGDNQKRVVGVLLGCFKSKGELDILNSFAVPFDEDLNNNAVWYVDHDYIDNMYGMFKKVNARERIVGWYHTAPKLCQNDIIINDLFARYCQNPLLVIINPDPSKVEMPTKAFVVKQEVHDDGTPTVRTFDHVPTAIGSEEAEEVGVEHLMRNHKDNTKSSLIHKVTAQLMGLKGLRDGVDTIKTYCERVAEGKMPVNHEISYKLQEIMSLMPNITNDDFIKTVFGNLSDEIMAVYVGAMLRTVTGLHDVILNKINNLSATTKRAEKVAAPAVKESKVNNFNGKKGDENKENIAK